MVYLINDTTLFHRTLNSKILRVRAFSLL